MYTRSTVRLACAALSVVVLGALGRSASAQNTYYTTGTFTIEAAHSVPGDAFVGRDSSGNTSDSQGHPYNATVNLVSGGSISGYLNAFSSSTVSVSGGSVASVLGAVDSSTINISGGTFGKEGSGISFFDSTTGAFTFIGSNLTAKRLGPDFLLPGIDYALSGTLQDGTNLSGYLINVSSAKGFTLQNTSNAVPEPGSVAMLVGLGISGAGLLARKRRARK